MSLTPGEDACNAAAGPSSFYSLTCSEVLDIVQALLSRADDLTLLADGLDDDWAKAFWNKQATALQVLANRLHVESDDVAVSPAEVIAALRSLAGAMSAATEPDANTKPR